MNTYARLSLILFLICALSAGALAFVDAATKDRIAANEEKKARILRGKALAGEQAGETVVFDAEPIPIDGRQYHVGRIEGGFVGTVFTTATNKGYSGPIEIVVAMDESGEIIAGVRIKSHSETPGLGANAVQIRYGDIEPWFLDQFSGLSPAQAILKKDDAAGAIDAITAATITSRAIADGVREASEGFGGAWGELKEKVADEREE